MPALADPPKTEAKKPAALPTGTMETADWLKSATTKLQPGEIDRMVGQHLDKMKIKSAPITTDEQFVRRVYLDLTGKLPAPSAITEFIGDKTPDKRVKLIDKLLDSDDYAKHWSQYWRNVITSKLTLDFRDVPLITHFERWMNEQFQANNSWGFVTRGDLRERSRLDRTLVVCMGEFGRTPRINANTGRDHYPRAFSVALAGGGVRGGQVIGATSAGGNDVANRPVNVADLFCSFCRSMGIDPRKENQTPIGRPIRIVDGGEAVRELFA